MRQAMIGSEIQVHLGPIHDPKKTCGQYTKQGYQQHSSLSTASVILVL
jgi:hypothetical protein